MSDYPVVIVVDESGHYDIDPPLQTIVIELAKIYGGECPWCGAELPSDGSYYCSDCDVDWDNFSCDELREKL